MELLIFCPFVIFFGLFLILIIGVIIYGLRRREVRAQRWRLFASQTGLIFEPGGLGKGMRVSGDYRGHRVVLDTFSHDTGYSAGSHSYPYTRISIGITNPANLDFNIQEKRLLLPPRDVFQIGDEQVDKRFTLSGRSQENTRDIFSDINIRHRILQTRSFNVEVQGPQLVFSRPGIETNLDYLIFLLDLMCDLTDYIG